MNKVFDIHI